MLDVVNSSYHLIIVIILSIYFYLYKHKNKRIILSHYKKAQISFFVLLFSASTVWIAGLLNYDAAYQVQKIMTLFFVGMFALVWLASDDIIQFINKN